MESAKQTKRMKIKVGEKESKLVMQAWMDKGDCGWQAVLDKVKTEIETVPINSRLLEYYTEGEDSRSLSRIKRIVREEQKRQAELFRKGQVINNSKKTVAEKRKKPDEKIREKLSEFVDSSSVSSSDNGEEECTQLLDKDMDEDQGVVTKLMRYAKKRKPEERKARKEKKLAMVVESDVSSDETMKPAPKKKQTVREATLEAQKAHTQMCEQAGSAMTLMQNMLTKLDKKLDEF